MLLLSGVLWHPTSGLVMYLTIRASSAEKDGLSAAHGTTFNAWTAWEHACMHINIHILKSKEYTHRFVDNSEVVLCICCPRYEWQAARSQALTSLLVFPGHCNQHMLLQSNPPPTAAHHGHHGNPVRVGVDDSLEWVRGFSLGQKERQCAKKEWRKKQSKGPAGWRENRWHPLHSPRPKVKVPVAEEQRQSSCHLSMMWDQRSACPLTSPGPCLQPFTNQHNEAEKSYFILYHR